MDRISKVSTYHYVYVQPFSAISQKIKLLFLKPISALKQYGWVPEAAHLCCTNLGPLCRSQAHYRKAASDSTDTLNWTICIVCHLATCCHKPRLLQMHQTELGVQSAVHAFHFAPTRGHTQLSGRVLLDALPSFEMSPPCKMLSTENVWIFPLFLLGCIAY